MEGWRGGDEETPSNIHARKRNDGRDLLLPCVCGRRREKWKEKKQNQEMKVKR